MKHHLHKALYRFSLARKQNYFINSKNYGFKSLFINTDEIVAEVYRPAPYTCYLRRIVIRSPVVSHEADEVHERGGHVGVERVGRLHVHLHPPQR